MKSQILLTIASFALTIDAQSIKPTQYAQESGPLFFEDNLPRNLNTNNPNLSSPVSQPNTQHAQTQLKNNSHLRVQPVQQNLRTDSKQDNKLKILNKPSIQHSNSQNHNEDQYQPFNQNDNLGNQNQNYHHQPANYNNLLNQNQNQYNQNEYETQSPNYHHRPSIQVLPPLENSQDYFATKQNLKQAEDIVHNRYSTTKVDTVPLSQMSLRNTSQDMKQASIVISHIGIFMMKTAKLNQSNIVVSPMSVVNMLALLQAGATGVTQEQVTKALRLTPEMSAATFQLMNTDFRKRGNQRNVLRSASSIFAADAFELNRDFKNFAIQNFGSEVSRISFDNPNVAAGKINSWIASKTNDHIDKLVSPDSIDVNTQLVLANAIYFKGLWETMFKPQATSIQDFYMSRGSKKSVPFMTLRSGFRAGLDKDNNAIVVVLPFESKQYSLVMLLPVPGADISSVLERLDGDTLMEYQNMRRQDVLIEIPKFTVRSNIDLEDTFIKMGITKMFSPASELNNIGLYRTTSPQVSSAVHSAMMSIDEQGATAAAATVVTVVALSYDNPSIVFRADRPFLAVLWDNQLKVPLFMAKIDDPSL